MSFSDVSSIVSFTRLPATVGLGLTTGLMLSIPAWSFPSMYNIKSWTAKDRLHFWSQTYDFGKNTMLVVLPILSTLFGSAAYFLKSSPLSPSLIARNRTTVLSLVAGLTFSIIPFTGLLIMKDVLLLQKVEKELETDPLALTKVDTDTVIKHWSLLHKARIAFGFSAFVLAVAELATH